MKSFFQALFAKRLVQHSDAFALTRKALWHSIAKSIKLQQSEGKSIWLVAHFHETFTECQSMLESNGIDYIVETVPVSPSWFETHARNAGHLVHLWLADLATPILRTENDDLTELPFRIAMMVAERHPFGPRDEKLIACARSLPATVEVGYFLAMEDELVKRLIPDQLIELMKTMGLQEQDLISSSIITKRLQKFIRRGSETADVAGDAESAKQWYEMQQS